MNKLIQVEDWCDINCDFTVGFSVSVLDSQLIWQTTEVVS